ncbi:MAG: type ISP restriction/modification enzyme, partial [Candidatus Delongbacteria bacterium]
EANHIKRDTPVMVVMGNPPYSILSSNLSKDQRSLVEKYKFIDNVRIKEKGALQLEKNLNDDYVKFIAFAEQCIIKNGIGVLAYINNNNFLDAITLRGMRWNLLNTFDEIHVIDLHGNSMKNEYSEDGIKDENVFDIQQGVSINIFVKTNRKKKNTLGKLYHYNLLGTRAMKYNFLLKTNMFEIPFNIIDSFNEKFDFRKQDSDKEKVYVLGFAIDNLMTLNVTGVKTHRDNLVIGTNREKIKSNIITFYDKKCNISETKAKLNLIDTGTWNAELARNKGNYEDSFFERILYRPFDTQEIYYDSNLIDCTRINIMQHFIRNRDNIGLVVPRQAITNNWSHVQVCNSLVDNRVHYSNKGTPICCPLYLYPEKDSKTASRTPNLNSEIVQKIADGLDLKFTNEKESDSGTFAPIDILDYIYAVLHSPTYREKYKEFLKIDFPRVPYPKDKETFWKLVRLGGELRQIHLLESPAVEKYITKYPADGDNVVNKIKFQDGKVYINDTQHFANVPEVAWNFYIGGYQPAQKWLKDRKGRKLEFEDILHYQKIIVALFETDRIMKEIDGVEVE